MLNSPLTVRAALFIHSHPPRSFTYLSFVWFPHNLLSCGTFSSLTLRRIDAQTKLFFRLSHTLFILELLGISILTLVIMSEQDSPHPD